MNKEQEYQLWSTAHRQFEIGILFRSVSLVANPGAHG